MSYRRVPFCPSLVVSQYTGGSLKVKSLLNRFVRDEQGQDLIEYTLLLAFVCLASAALFIGAGGGVNAIWANANAKVNGAAAGL
jgi:Flp pilus assembly pilin Flp